MIEVREPTIDDLRKVLGDVRQEDMQEWYAGTGQLFRRSAAAAILSPGIKRVALEDGVPLCFWGCDEGVVWLFATNNAANKATKLHRLLKPHMAELLGMFGKLDAYADCRNATHHRWLRWLGFEERQTYLIGPFRLPFVHFHKEPDQCA